MFSSKCTLPMVLYLMAYLSEECIGEDSRDDDGQFMNTFQTKKNIKENEIEENLQNIYTKTPDRVMKYGYPVETHVIQTDDGYLLTVHRIPHGRSSSDSRVRAPVLVMHGLFDSSDGWTLAGPQKGLGFILADAGYDVWLGNARGNFYSRKHVSLSPSNPAFWNFTWHEMGNHDLPTVIDYILDKTDEKQLFYIGHSMGTTMYFVLTSMQPEYNDKIRLMVALAPAIYIKAQRNYGGMLFSQFGRNLADAFFRTGQFEIFPRSHSNALIGQNLCHDGQRSQAVCSWFYNELFGNGVSKQLNKTMLPLILSIFPSGASVATCEHFIENLKSGNFHGYDKTRRSRPMPKYDLSQVRAPVALYYSLNDALVSFEGVLRLSHELPKVVSMFEVSDQMFNHFDFVLGIEVKQLVYNNVISLMTMY